MKPADGVLEDMIRERAYHLWEANGRPIGRDQEFWYRASDAIASDDEEPSTKAQPRRPARAASTTTQRKSKR